MHSDRDPILDACLEELLGGQTPPDLTPQILRALAEQQVGGLRRGAASGIPLPLAGRSDDEPLPPPVQPSRYRPADHEPALNQLAVPGGNWRSQAARQRLCSRRTFVAFASLGALLGAVAVGLGTWFLGSYPHAQQRLARQADVDQADVDQADKAIRSSRDAERNGRSPAAAGGDGAVAEGGPPDARSAVVPIVPEAVAGAPTDAPRFEATPPLPLVADGTPADRSAADRGGLGDAPPAYPPTAYPPAAPLPDSGMVTMVNAHMRQTWAEHGVQPSAAASDAEWCRRVYLRVLGRVPAPVELERFVNDGSPQRRSELLDELLEGEVYRHEFADYWSSIWSELLIGGVAVRRDLVSSEGMQQYLRAAILAKKPYDRMVFELLTATGTNRPGTPDFNGATNFLLAGYEPRAARNAIRTARIFLGRQLQCAECHDHPVASQQQFWQLAAFFRQMQVERDEQQSYARLENGDFLGDGDGDGGEAEVYYEQPNGRLKVAYPAFLDGGEIQRSGLLSEVDRRRELAQLMTRSPALGSTVVNRLWGHFFGVEFSRSVDELAGQQSSVHAELHAQLAEQFRSHGYRLRPLMRWMALSEPFGLSSQARAENLVDAPDSGQPLFSRFYEQPLRDEEVAKSLELVARLQREGAAGSQQELARRLWLEQLSNRSMRSGGRPEGAIREPLAPLNSPLLQQTLDPEGSIYRQIVDSQLSVDEKVNHLFLAAVARGPNGRERRMVEQIMQQHGDPAIALQDIWWALLSSEEFRRQ